MPCEGCTYDVHSECSGGACNCTKCRDNDEHMDDLIQAKHDREFHSSN